MTILFAAAPPDLLNAPAGQEDRLPVFAHAAKHAMSPALPQAGKTLI